MKKSTIIIFVFLFVLATPCIYAQENGNGLKLGFANSKIQFKGSDPINTGTSVSSLTLSFFSVYSFTEKIGLLWEVRGLNFTGVTGFTDSVNNLVTGLNELRKDDYKIYSPSFELAAIYKVNKSIQLYAGPEISASFLRYFKNDEAFHTEALTYIDESEDKIFLYSLATGLSYTNKFFRADFQYSFMISNMYDKSINFTSTYTHSSYNMISLSAGFIIPGLEFTSTSRRKMKY